MASSTSTRTCAILITTIIVVVIIIIVIVKTTPYVTFLMRQVRPVPLEIHIQGYDIPHVPSRLLAMSKPAYYSVVNHAADKPAIIFVPSAKQARVRRDLRRDVRRAESAAPPGSSAQVQLTAVDMLTYATADDAPRRFLHASAEDIAPFVAVLKEGALAHTVAYGIAFLHEGLSEAEQKAVLALHASGAVQVLVATHSMCWGLTAQAHLVVLMDTQFYDGAEHRRLARDIRRDRSRDHRIAPPLRAPAG